MAQSNHAIDVYFDNLMIRSLLICMFSYIMKSSTETLLTMTCPILWKRQYQITYVIKIFETLQKPEYSNIISGLEVDED